MTTRTRDTLIAFMFALLASQNADISIMRDRNVLVQTIDALIAMAAWIFVLVWMIRRDD